MILFALCRYYETLAPPAVDKLTGFSHLEIAPKMPTLVDLSPNKQYIPSNASSAIALPDPLRDWQFRKALLTVKENLRIIEALYYL
ncbi:MAG: hypothetical protein IGS49_22815 [Chlorogloeopsis fritschii C42_A2020_084]|uniref:hypothetical protein n=1 Tax=Chlorogloeopsis fritschii TaxID=1124 RepID=UPI0019E2BD0E|nr:hypothetical protein [Chlorogloeopsis fritschii]MBF2008197.1 hypothetical protein [Chlorogloeopsis fritschii C42_A2020_084]